MKKIITTVFGLFLTVTMFAQTAGDIALAKSGMTIERKAIFSQNMNLSDDEAKLFWPIFEEYEAKKSKTFEQSLKNLTNTADNLEGMTDEKAKEIITGVMKNQQANLKLLNAYQKKVAKALGAKKAFRFVLIEEQIDAIMKVQVLEIPYTE